MTGLMFTNVFGDALGIAMVAGALLMLKEFFDHYDHISWQYQLAY